MALQAEIDAALQEANPRDLLRLMARRQFKMALEGNPEAASTLGAMKEIIDRLDGKAPIAIGQDADLGAICISWDDGKNEPSAD